jgi:hypothetical protein
LTSKGNIFLAPSGYFCSSLALHLEWKQSFPREGKERKKGRNKKGRQKERKKKLVYSVLYEK